MTFTLTTYSEEETVALGSRLGALLCGGDVVLLDGDLGAGKTRFVQGVAKGLGVTGIVTSPTFNLVLEYPIVSNRGTVRLDTSSNGEDSEPHLSEDVLQRNTPLSRSLVTLPTAQSSPKLLRHFDLYRLERADQLDDLDYFGLIEERDAVSLVEWGSKFASRLPLDYVLVCIMVAEDNPVQRLIEISAEGSFSRELLERIVLIEGMQ